MPKSYEIAITVSKNPKQEQYRRCCWHPSLTQIAVLSVITSIVAILAVVMCVKSTLYETTLPQEFYMTQSVETIKIILIPELLEKPMVENRYTVYDVPLSVELQHYTQDVCDEYGVSYPLALALMKIESGFSPDAVSATNDYGIMQINQGNHKWLEGKLGITDWLDPKQNILAGVYMLSQFNGYEDVHQILMSYNCGPSGAKKLWAEGIYSTAYSRAVVEILNGLEVMAYG